MKTLSTRLSSLKIKRTLRMRWNLYVEQFHSISRERGDTYFLNNSHIDLADTFIHATHRVCVCGWEHVQSHYF